MPAEPLSEFALDRQTKQLRHFRLKCKELEKKLEEETAGRVLFRQKVSDLVGRGPNEAEEYILIEIERLIEEVVAFRKRSARR